MSTDKFVYNIIHDKDSLNIELKGKLNYLSSPSLKKELDRILKSEVKINKIIVDLKNISFMDTSGLSTFIYYVRNYKNIMFEFINPSKITNHVFSLTDEINLNDNPI